MEVREQGLMETHPNNISRIEEHDEDEQHVQLTDDEEKGIDKNNNNSINNNIKNNNNTKNSRNVVLRSISEEEGNSRMEMDVDKKARKDDSNVSPHTPVSAGVVEEEVDLGENAARKRRRWRYGTLMMVMFVALIGAMTAGAGRMPFGRGQKSSQSKLDATESNVTTGVDSGSGDGSPDNNVTNYNATMIPTSSPISTNTDDGDTTPTPTNNNDDYSDDDFFTDDFGGTSIDVSKVPTTPRPTKSPTKSPTKAPSITGFPTRVPTYPGGSYWKQISPRLHRSNSNSEEYGYSVSLSAEGKRLAVLHKGGITIYEQQGTTSIWNVVGAPLTSDQLMEDVFGDDNGDDVPESWDNLMDVDTSLISTQVTLSFDGSRFMWDVSYNGRGRAVLYKYFEDSKDGTSSWTRLSDVLKTGGHPGGKESGQLYGSSFAYARADKDRILSGSFGGTSALVMELHPTERNWRQVEDSINGYDVLDALLAESSLFGTDEDNINAYFGASVAMSADGEIAAVASPQSPMGGDAYGKVVMFRITDLFGLFPIWRRYGNVLKGNVLSNNFGKISMAKNGARIAVGTPNLKSDRVGRINLYDFNSDTKTWLSVGTIDGTTTSEDFGYTLSLSEDGKRVAIISPNKTDGTGRVCMYAFVNERFFLWEQVGNCVSPGTISEVDVPFFSVSLSSDGSRMAVGTPANLEGDAYVTVYQLTPM